ncbi:MAG: hypothetical protein EP297_08670 [Gammaproteobacteria bacterium]|nr:MAG: hypothetical protein EP297_08670 [Gammaproteobacteria bacterium]
MAASFSTSNFTMLDPDGRTFGGTNDVVAEWDESLNTDNNSTNFNMSLGSASDWPFFGFPWFAHHIRVFGPGSYLFDTSCTADQVQATGGADCGGAPDEFFELNIPEGMIGAHFLLDWNVTKDIDVLQLWDLNTPFTNPNPGGPLYQGPAGQTPSLDTVYSLASVDGDGDDDGTPGFDFIDGPFIGFSMNLNLTEVPVPAAAWLFGSGMIVLIGISRRKKAA